MTSKLAIGLVGLGVILVVADLAGDASVSRDVRKDRITVTYWEKWTGAEADEMRKTVNAYNASQDKVFVQYLSISGVDSKTMLAAAGGNPPDVAGLWLDQVPQFADANALTDLTPMAQATGVSAKDYIPSFYNGLVYQGKLLALPSTPATICLYVRKDMVPKEFASPETFPKTISAFDALMFKISKRRPDGSLAQAGFLPSSPGWYNWSWALLFGGKMIDGDRVTIDTPEAERAFEWIASYSKTFGARDITTFQGGFGAFASPQDPFMDGKTVTEVNGPWKASYIDTFRKGLPWFSVPFPYPDDRPDLANHSFVNEDIFIIPRGAKHAKEAFDFIRFVQRQDQMERLCIAHGKNTPLVKVSDAFFAKHPNPDIRVFDKMARSPSCALPAPIGIWPQIRNEIDVAFQEVNTGQKTPKEALAGAQSRVDDLWNVYRVQVKGGTN